MIGNTIKVKGLIQEVTVLDKINAPGVVKINLEEIPAFFDHYLVNDGTKVFTIPCGQVEEVIDTKIN